MSDDNPAAHKPLARQQSNASDMLKAPRSHMLRTISESTEPRTPTPIKSHYSASTLGTNVSTSPVQTEPPRPVMRRPVPVEARIEEPVVTMSSSLLAMASAPLDRFSDPPLPTSRSDQSFDKLRERASVDAEEEHDPDYAKRPQEDEGSTHFDLSEPEDDSRVGKADGVSWKVWNRT